MVFENRALREKFGAKREEITGTGDNYRLRSCKVCKCHQILLALSSPN
jgi:hypothetical protein